MDPQRASLTAIGTALMRAAHTRLDDDPLIEDPWGERLIPEAEREQLRQIAGDGDGDGDLDLRTHPAYGIIIVRTRYTEDALHQAVTGGAQQYVILGAGLDSFGLRRPAWARDLRIFEVDHPATQAFKRERLAAAGVPEPQGLRFVPADLSRDDLDEELGRAGFDSARKAFFSWLGVTAYLPREANLATLCAIAGTAAPGSELVFTYIEAREFDAERRTAAAAEIQKGVASLGEPMVSGFEPAALAGELRAAGLTLIEDLSGADLHERYCAGRPDGLTPMATNHVARAARD